MKLYASKDMKDYLYLSNRYNEMTTRYENYSKGKQPIDYVNSIESKFYLSMIKATKDMMENLGVEVPDDKAKELGFDGV